MEGQVSKGRPRHRNGPTPPRKFTDSFRLGQAVSIKRTRHGWFDGQIMGKTTSISEYSCAVTVDDGEGYVGDVLDIERPRDIY
jgi:hypothetical protein